MTSPIISTLIITRPREPRLGLAIASALRQQGPDFEVVLVFDGACAENLRIASAFEDARLRMVQQPKTLGRGAARARGVEACRGQWIANVDADDWIFSDKNLRQWRFLETNPEVDVVSGGLLIVDRAGVPTGVRSHCIAGMGVSGASLPPLFTPSLMVRASLAQRVGFDPAYRAGEDREFLYRALADARWAAIDDPSYVYDEYASHSLVRCLSSYRRRVVLDARYGGARAAARSAAVQGAKAIGATVAFGVGMGDALVRRRSAAPTSAQVARYQKEHDALQETMRRLGCA